jgi:hypothetical protein
MWDCDEIRLPSAVRDHAGKLTAVGMIPREAEAKIKGRGGDFHTGMTPGIELSFLPLLSV